MVCKSSNALAPLSAQTADTNVRASYSIASYSAGDYTIQWRVVGLSAAGTPAVSCSKNPLGGVRVGTSDNAVRSWIGTTNTNSQISGANILDLNDLYRSSAGSNGSSVGHNSAFPVMASYPVWMRIVRRGGYVTQFVSPDGILWMNGLATTTDTNAANASVAGTAEMTTWELPIGVYSASTAAFVEIDLFSITAP